MTTIDEVRDCVICGVPMDGKTVHIERLHHAAREGKLPAPTIDEAFEQVRECLWTDDDYYPRALAALTLIRERMDELEGACTEVRAVAERRLVAAAPLPDEAYVAFDHIAGITRRAALHPTERAEGGEQVPANGGEVAPRASRSSGTLSSAPTCPRCGERWKSSPNWNYCGDPWHLHPTEERPKAACVECGIVEHPHYHEEERCMSGLTDRNDEHATYRCELPSGHEGVHSSGTASWTGR